MKNEKKKHSYTSPTSVIEQDEEKDNSNLWLVSYADMMTLIACFFILMVAFANYDPVGFNDKTKVFSKFFRIAKNKSSVTKLDFIREELIKHPNIKKMTKVTMDDDQLVIRFSGTVLFEQGEWQIRPEMLDTIDSFVDIIKNTNYEYRIVIIGHTAALNINRNGAFTSDWQLSSARAASLADRFEFYGFDPKLIVPLGRGHTEPLGKERDKSGRVQKESVLANNRVEVRILSPMTKGAKKLKIGLGVLFAK